MIHFALLLILGISLPKLHSLESEAIINILIIYLASHLADQERLWVCEHELGHSILHRGLNRIFMTAHTRMVTSRYELEADKFAVDLLFSDEDLSHFIGESIHTAAACMCVNYELAEYRMNHIQASSYKTI